MNDFIKWCIKRHEDCNHKYAEYLPYQLHLEMTEKAYLLFKHIVPRNMYNFVQLQTNVTTEEEYVREKYNQEDLTYEIIIRAIWGHDLIEDTRTSYKQIKNFDTSSPRDRFIYENVAEIIYAVTDPKGRTRDERHSNEYYQGIRDVPGADFVKLCDRYANILYGFISLQNNKTYRDEHPKFKKELYTPQYEEFWSSIDSLLKLSEKWNIL